MRILIADDNRDAVLSLVLLLDDEGHQVHGVHRGDEVMPAIRAFNPDVVLLDIKMPGLSGYDVARQIRERYGERRPLLIAVSGHYKKGSDHVLAEIVGFNHYVDKPYQPSALLSLLKI
ncbi:MAG: response regulator [Burkholderiales bacterium]